MTTSYGSITIVDIGDLGELTVTPESNQPSMVVYDPNGNNGTGSYNPDWSVSNLVLTPIIYYGNTQLTSSTQGLTVRWYTKDSETVLANTFALTVNSNVLANLDYITYVVKVSYVEPSSQITLQAEGQISFSKVNSASQIKSITISGDTTFLTTYDSNNTPTITPSSITLTATSQFYTGTIYWYYKNGNTWVSASTGTTKNISATDAGFLGGKMATYRATSASSVSAVGGVNEIFDIHTLTKISDGTNGSNGTTTKSVVLSNEDEMVPFTSESGTGTYTDCNTTISVFDGATNITRDTTLCRIFLVSRTAAQVESATEYTTSNVSGYLPVGTSTGSVAITGTNVTGTWTKSTLTCQINSLTSDTGRVIFYVYYKDSTNGWTLITNKKFSLTKVYPGKDGDAAVFYRLNVSSLTTTHGADTDTVNTYSPSSITLAAQKIEGNNSTVYSSAQYLYSVDDGTPIRITTSSGTLTFGTDTGQILPQNNIVVQLVESGTSNVLDTQTIAVITDGATGTPGQPGPQGAPGSAGASITNAVPIYYLKTSSIVPTKPADGFEVTSTSTGVNAWTKAIPTYVNGGVYYTSIQNFLSSGTSPISSDAQIDNALTDSNATAFSANTAAQAAEASAAAIAASTKYFWSNSTGTHMASGNNSDFSESDSSTWGYNAQLASGSLKLGINNKYPMQLTSTDLTFLDITNGTKPYVKLDSSGLSFYDGTKTTSQGLKLLAKFSSTGYIQSGNYIAPSTGVFANAGTLISLETGEIITKYFKTNNSGAWFSGNITASSGTIGGWTITNSYLASARTFQDTQTDGTFIFLSNGLSETELQVLDITSENWSIKIGNTFGILEDGSAYIGQSDLRSGKIGPFSFSNNGLSYTITTVYTYFSVTNSSTLTDWHITRTSNDEYVGLYGGEPIDGGQPTNPSADMLSQMTILKYKFEEDYQEEDYQEENYQIVSSISIGQDGVSFGGNDNIYISAIGDMYIGAEAGSQAISVNPTLNYLDYDVTEQKITFFFDSGKINSLNVVNETVENSNISILNASTVNITSLYLDALGQEIEVGQFINQLNNNTIALSDYLNRAFYLKTEIDTKVNNLTTLINTTATNIIDTYTLPQVASFLHFTGENMYIGKTGTSLMNFSTSLLEVVSTSLGVTSSLFFQGNDNAKAWAYRRGSEVIPGKPNLNDVWIGG